MSVNSDPKYKLRPSIGIGGLCTALLNASFKETVKQNSGANPVTMEYKFRKTHFGYYINLGIEYELKTADAVFLGISLENYAKSDASQWQGKDKIKTPNIFFGYTFK